MKRIVCLITVLCIIFGSFSLCFSADATWSTSDSQNLANTASRLYYMNQSAAYYLYNIASNTQNTYNKLVDIYNALFYGNHNITYWVNAINTWMSPIYNAIVNIPLDLDSIENAIYENLSNGSRRSYLFNLKPLYNGMNGSSVSTAWTWDQVFTYGNSNLFTYHPEIGGSGFNGSYDTPLILPNGSVTNVTDYWQNGSPFANIVLAIARLTSNHTYESVNTLSGFSSTQNVINWGNLGTSTFTPVSQTDGLYKYLASIQAPVARLSYVLASDADIEAREAATLNQEAVVDNFIDSSGNGYASPSDIGSISDLSAGYQNNFGSDAQVTGIFNIFNSNNMGWFSQETANQLDTTTPTRRGSSFDTPLLDQHIEDIYNQIGVQHD